MSEKSSSMGKDFILFASKASRLMENNKMDQALNLCETGVRSFPFYAPGHFVLGLCYHALDKKDDAKNEFERTLLYDPAHSKAMRKLSEHYQASGLQQIADEYLIKEAIYYPLDHSLINLLKEKDLYKQINPEAADIENEPIEDISTEKENVSEEDTALEEDIKLPLDILTSESEEASKDQSGSNPELPLTEEILDKDETEFLEQAIEDEIEEPAAENETIDDLDPLAEGTISKKADDEDHSDDEKTVGKDLNQFANMEDDFSTIMDGYFSGDEENDQKSTENDEWIEVENLLIDEEETSSQAAESQNVETNDDEIDDEIVRQETRQETELLLERLSDSESVGEQKQNDLADSGKKFEPEENADKQEQEVFSEEPASDNKVTTEQSLEEEVTIKDLMENPNLVTPTFGEILVSQHKFTEARHIFSELLKKEPENEKFIKKVEFLDKFIETEKA